MMLQTAKELAKLDLHSIKIHLMHVLKGTVLAQMYEQGEFETMSMQEYVNTVCDQLEVLPQELVIQRVTGDGARDELIAPLWSLKKFCVMNEIDKELGRRDSWQGIKFAH
jgi:radical SAM protein (TIGR01212 family)